jgi:hypothetical protein
VLTVQAVGKAQQKLPDEAVLADACADGRAVVTHNRKDFRRKNVFLDPETLRRAQEILGTRSESEAIREALELVALRHEVMQGFDAVAGKAPEWRDIWQEK